MFDETLPRIHNDEDWLDLKIGDKALLSGKVKLNHGDKTVLVCMPDWSQTAVEVTDINGIDTGGKSFQTSDVVIVVERTEDGIQTSGKAIFFNG